jgi:hypothetical protein
MTPSGIGPRDALALARHAQSAASPKGPLLVTGVLAEALARELRSGGDASLVRTDGDPAGAAAVVRVVAGAATPEDERVLRAATRALVPTVVVQTGDPSARIPYVLATDLVECKPGRGFPVDEIVHAFAAALGRDGAALAATLPVLREAVQSRRIEDGAVTAGALAAASGGSQRLPVLALAQARMLSDVATAGGAARPEAPRAVAEAVGPRLVAALGAGLAARTLVRRLPVRNRLLESAVAAVVTYALATAFRRFGRR